jgi:predicted Na+-dependent transporter
MLAARDLLTPVIVMSVLSILHVPRPAILGATLLAISPGALLTPRGGVAPWLRSEIGFGVSVISTLSSIVTFQFWLPVVCGLFVADASVAPTAVAQLVAVLFLLPLGVGAAVRRYEPTLMKSMSRPVIIVSDVLLSLALLSLLDGVVRVLPQLGAPFVCAAVCVPSIAVLAGVLTRTSSGRRRSELAVVCSARHPGFVLLIMGANFAGDVVMAAVVVSFLGGLTASTLYTYLTRHSRASLLTAVEPVVAIVRDDGSLPTPPVSPTT